MDSAVGRVDTVGRTRVRGVSSKAPARHIDFSLIVTAVLLTGFGNLMVYSASRVRLAADGLPERHLLNRQVFFSLVGFGLMVFLTLLSYRRFRAWGALAYLAGVAMLAIVLTGFGSAAAGAQRWIDLGFFQFQPSEFVKVAVLVVAAMILADARGRATGADAVKVIGVVSLPAVLIYLQPDLGTLLVLIALSATLIVVAGTRLRVLLILIALAVVAVWAVLQLGLLKEYQLARLTGFLDPTADPQRTGYNLNQARIAVGSGQVLGKGLFSGSQTNLDFVPEVHTDFIFTAVGEEFGFVGACALLALFAAFIWRGLRIAMLSKDMFGTLLAAGIVGVFTFQMFVNIGMTIGVSPITGIPLPFVSYGGSSMITSWIMTGILLNVHMRRLI